LSTRDAHLNGVPLRHLQPSDLTARNGHGTGRMWAMWHHRKDRGS